MQRLPAVYNSRKPTQQPRRLSMHIQYGDNLVGEACRHMLPVSRPAHLRQLSDFAPESLRVSACWSGWSGIAGSSSNSWHRHTYSCMLHAEQCIPGAPSLHQQTCRRSDSGFEILAPDRKHWAPLNAPASTLECTRASKAKLPPRALNRRDQVQRYPRLV